MNQESNFIDDDMAVLAPAWSGLLGVGMGGKPDMSFDNIALAQMKSALLQRVRAAAEATTEPTAAAPSTMESSAPEHQIILNNAEWQVISPKIQVKVLRNDGIAMSWLLKLAANTRFPAHAHSDFDVECLVLEGSLRLDGKTLHVGDYTVGRQGSEHADVYTEAGCVVFLKSPAAHQAGLARLCEA